MPTPRLLTRYAAVNPALQLCWVPLKHPLGALEFYGALVTGRCGGDPARNLHHHSRRHRRFEEKRPPSHPLAFHYFWVACGSHLGWDLGPDRFVLLRNVRPEGLDLRFDRVSCGPPLREALAQAPGLEAVPV